MADQEKKVASTSTLLQRLFKSPDLKSFFMRNAKEMQVPPFNNYIKELSRKSGMIPEQVIKQSAIERTYGHQLFNGTRKPSRDKVIQLAIGFGLNLDDTQELLKVAQKSALYPRIKRDAAIIYCINNREDIYETQCILESLHLSLLGKEEKIDQRKCA